MEVFIVLILFIHFVADFICQSDRVATGKSKDIVILTEHIVLYGSVLLVAIAIINFTYYKFNDLGLYVGVNMGLHLITDFFTSKLTTYLWVKEKRHWFFVVIGLDQFIHTATLILTLKYL